MQKGEPASIWQLEEVRNAFGSSPCVSAAGHQCQFPGVDRKKPTRLYSDILEMGEFGHRGWPRFDSRGFYIGPLPKHCGHIHKEKTIGRDSDGGFNISPSAAYPSGMCYFIALRIFNDFKKRASTTVGGGSSSSGA